MVVTGLLSYSVLAAVTLTTVELLSAMEWLSHRAATNRPLQFQILVAMGLWFLVQAGVFTVIGYAMRSQLEAGLLRPRSFLVSGGLCLLAGMTVFVSTCCLFFAITGNLGTELVPRWLLLASLLPFGFAAISRLAAIEVVRSRQWTSLDIAD